MMMVMTEAVMSHSHSAVSNGDVTVIIKYSSNNNHLFPDFCHHSRSPHQTVYMYNQPQPDIMYTLYSQRQNSFDISLCIPRQLAVLTLPRHHNEAWIPTLRLLHQYHFLLTPQMVDKGAIKFVLSGANIMCPGKGMS